MDALLRKNLIPFTVYQPTSAADGERPFLQCGYNRTHETGKYRSPWTGKIRPSDDDATTDLTAGNDSTDPDNLRLLELTLNEVWDAYKNLYYGHDAVGSVYLRHEKGALSVENSTTPFQGMFGICKHREGSGNWHSVSLIRVDEPSDEGTCHYRVETHVLVVIEPKPGGNDVSEGGVDPHLNIDLSASVSKEVSKELKIDPNIITMSHIENIGELIESNEMDLRSQLEQVLFPKALLLLDTLMKEEKQTFRPVGVNPLMGMIMDSAVLKKKMEKKHATDGVDDK